MYYYKLSIIKSPLELLTYQSNTKLSINSIINTTLRNKSISAVIVQEVSKPDFKCIELSQDDITLNYFDDRQVALAKFISNYYICSLGEAFSLFIPFQNNIDNNIDKKVKEITLKNKLSPIQNQAKYFFDTYTTSLLFADTGSGKTEIYINIIKEYIDDNKQVLFLMPEISLTPQMEKRLKEVFGDIIAVWHSKITKKTKEKITTNLLNGTVKIIAGARSSLFLPFSNLGLIIVDEEHDDAYKSQQKPKVNVKDLSCYYASKFGIKTLLGSATPSLNSYHKFPHFRIKGTFYDSKKHINYVQNSEHLTNLIIQRIEHNLSNSNQAIVFLPTRANYKYQICDSCGESIECPFCSVSLSLHRDNRILKCHYCNYTQKITSICPTCQKENKKGILKNFRIGTSEVVEHLKDKFPTYNIAQFDRDKITTHTKLKKVLKSFDDREIDILVGTQMLSKGHDYPNVSLVIIIGIDSVLKMNDFRSREKALSLFKQISGRSGRAKDGEVIVQTNNSEFFTLYEDYEEFLKDELEFRRGLYPPFVKFAKITFGHKNANISNDAMTDMLKKLQSIIKNKNIEIVGYGQSQIFKVANKYYFEILLRCSDIKVMLQAIVYSKNDLAIVDIDPI